MRIAWIAGWLGGSLLLAGTGRVVAADGPTTKDNLSHSATWETSRTQETRLKEAENHIQAGRISKALAPLQNVLNETPAFVSNGEGLENSHAAAHRLLGSIPASGVKQYEEQFGSIARTKFRVARRNADLDQLRTIADQYRMTEAGYDALRFSVLWDFDHANFLPAAAGFQALADHPFSKSQNALDPRDAARWIIALSRAGLTDEAERIANQYRLEKLVQRLIPQTIAGQDGVFLRNLPSMKPLWQKTFALPGPAEKRLQSIRKDLEQRGLLPISSGTPLVVGKRVIARHFEEIFASDLETGVVQWRKPLKSQTVQLAQNEGLMANPEFRRMLTRQLGSAAFADRNAGTLTSDGSRVFVVLNEHGRFLNIPGWNINQSQGNDWSTGLACCQLTALDAETGKELWRRPAQLPHRDPVRQKISGRIRDPRPEVFFFGPPTPLGDSLYAIGQKDREICLFVLSPETGETQWSLPLVATDLPLRKDRARGRLALPVVCQNGLLLCPTGAGALAAVDPHSRSCRWIFRYARNDTPQLSPGAIPAGNPKTHARLDRWWTGWRDVGLVVSGETALLISPESHSLHAVSLKTGETRWTAPRDEGLFLVKGIQGQALIIGSQSLRIIDAETGERLKTLSTPTPAGRGIATATQTGQSFLLPLSAGGFLEVDLTHKTRRTFPSQRLPMGNLTLSGNTVIFQSSAGLQRLALLHPKSQIPEDAENRLTWAKSQRESGRFREAVKVLKELHAKSPTEENTAELRQTMILEIANHPERAADLTKELEPLLTSASDCIRGWQTIAKAEQQVGRSRAALQAWLQVMAQNPTGTFTPAEDSTLEISYSRYVQGTIADLLHTAEEDVKHQLERSLDTHRTDTLNRRDPFAVSRFARRFDQLKWGRELIVGESHRTGIGQTALEQQLELWAIAETAKEPSLQAMALRRLAEDRLSELQYREAAFFYRRLEKDFEEVRFPDGQSVAEFLKALPDESPVRSFDREKERWPHTKPQVTKEQRGGKQPPWYPVPIAAQPGSLGEELDCWLAPERKRLRFAGGNHRGFWELTLPDKKGDFNFFSPFAWSVGPVLVLQYRNNFLGIAPLDDHGEPRPRVLWQLPIAKMGEGEDHFNYSEIDVQLQQPPPGFGVPNGEALDHYQQRFGQVGQVTAGMLVYQSEGRLFAIDPATGGMLWSRSQVPVRAMVASDATYVLLVHRNNSRVTVLRGMDGRVLAKRDVPSSEQLLRWYGGRALLKEESQAGVTFKLWDAVTDRIVWQQNAPEKTLAFGVDSETWGFLTPTGKLTLSDTETGRLLSTTPLESVQDPDQVYALVDERRIYLGIRHERPNPMVAAKSPILDDLSLRHPVFSGTLHAFDRRTGETLWQTGWDHWALPLEQPATGPVLVLFHREKIGDDKKRSVLRCLEKRTGREVFSAPSPELYEALRWEGSANQNEFEIQAIQTTIRLKYE